MSVLRSVKYHHDEWLNLLERSGPFLTVPVLSRVWPAGLDPITSDAMDEFRQSFDKWREDRAGDQRRWIDFVLAEFLDWRDCLAEGPNLNPGFELVVPEHGTTVRADFAFVSPDAAPRLLGVVLPPNTQPQARTVGTWSASPADRLALLLRRHQVPLGLATDGRWWALVWAPPDGATSVSVWDGALWLEERQTLAAFRCLLERRRFLGVPDADTLPELLRAGLAQQEEITVNLGRQVRRAVEMLVEAIGRSGRHGGPAEQLLAAIEPAEVYHGAVTVMMRLLFLLFAEERLLLPADDELYLASYSAGRLVDELRSEASLTSEEALELRTAAWQRLLSLFRGVHSGIAHDRVHLRAYGGVVFDPDRHPWLEGRSAAETPDNARVLPIDDRTVLHALEALQYVTLAGERRRLSFRTLDVEQIGYVYEGLLGYDALRASGPVLGIVGKKGEETEVSLSEIEAIGKDAEALAARLETKPAQVAKLLDKEVEIYDDQLLRVACSGDEDLMTRIHPYFHLLRDDLRGLPVVIPAGGLYVTDSPRRRLSGTHYTPRDLAEKVVIGALEPLVFSPGPLDTDDRTTWRHRSSAEILSLKVADIAMGSGAFLVSACRYLAGALLEAWAAEGDVRAIEHLQGGATTLADSESDPVVIDARRQIIEHCLYGGDINEMAVEMAKLSLWLVSLSRERPFSFLDDRLVCGDSLLGLTSTEQLRLLHLNPAKARKEAGDRGFDLWGQMRTRLDEVERLRIDIAQRPLLDVRDFQIKERLLLQADEVARPLAAIADALVGAAMAGEDLILVAPKARHVLNESNTDAQMMRVDELADTARYKLDTDRPEGAFERRPTHWPLSFPEVFESGGFDAVIGNPPFLGGQKLTGAFGTAYREFLVRWVAGGARGSADLLAYFLLVANRILNDHGQTGLIGTNTMAQGNTREVGLDQLIADGTVIRAAIKSAHWPTRSVNLEYSVLWASRQSIASEAARYLDGQPVTLISSSLDAADQDLGKPHRLTANADISFQGSIVLGAGFVLSAAAAQQLIHRDVRNREVLFPYVNGEDLNSRPDSSASRWIINFKDWPLERAREYRDCFDLVELLVKPLRQRQRPDGSYTLRRPLPEKWWIYAEKRPGLYRTIDGMSDVLAIALTSKVVMPVRVPTGMVYSHAVGVFAYNDGGHLALLSSAFHYWWAITYASTMRTDLRYTPSDVFETLPEPNLSSRLIAAGDALDSYRRSLMLRQELGLTALYSRLHASAVEESDVARLREIHVGIDNAVAEAYGWGDISLNHGFHQTAQGVRFTISEPARRELLKRLLELNHLRHAEEVAQGLTGRKGRRGKHDSGQMKLVEA
jgi:hypothetical protein